MKLSALTPIEPGAREPVRVARATHAAHAERIHEMAMESIVSYRLTMPFRSQPICVGERLDAKRGRALWPCVHLAAECLVDLAMIHGSSSGRRMRDEIASRREAVARAIGAVAQCVSWDERLGEKAQAWDRLAGCGDRPPPISCDRVLDTLRQVADYLDNRGRRTASLCACQFIGCIAKVLSQGRPSRNVAEHACNIYESFCHESGCARALRRNQFLRICESLGRIEGSIHET